MKVVFKLNTEQIQNTKKVMAEVIEPQFEGDLLGYLDTEANPCLNTNQRLSLSGDEVTYEGERHPLHQDGGLTLLWKIAQGEIPKFPYLSEQHHLREQWCEARIDAAKSLSVSIYETSDRSLEWYETKYHQVLRKMKEGSIDPSFIKEVLFGITSRETHYLLKEWERELLEWVVKNHPPVTTGTPEYRRAVASGDQEWVLLSAQAAKLLE